MREALTDALVGELEDGVLGMVQDDLGLVFLFKCLVRDLVCCFN